MSNTRVDASGQDAVSVTPSDSAQINHPMGQSFTKGIYVGVTGDVAVVMAGGGSMTFPSLSAGIFHPLSVKQVKSTGTTATTIIAVY